MVKGLLNEIISRGDRGAVVPFYRIYDLKNDMITLKNGEYHTDWLNRMANHITDDANKFIPANLSFETRSLISVVMPSPKAIFQFCYRGELINCTVPPVQSNFYQNHERVLRYVNDYLSPLGFSAVKAVTLPHKMLAVHCGLGKYGRNNICYSAAFGSYMHIMTYISDLPCDDTMWVPIKRMETCDKCCECVTACPTKAIDTNRLLIDSDRCITYYNEIPGEFPDWLGKDVHNSIVGCIKCQDCCPANSQNEDNVEMGTIFTEYETTELLNNNGDLPYSESLAAKLGATGIPPEFARQDVLPRNLKALLTKHP